MATAWKEQLNAGFEKAKTAGGLRWSNIYAILQKTLPQIWTEISAGAKELGDIGTEVANVTQDVIREESRVKAATTQERLGLYAQRLIEYLKEAVSLQLKELQFKSLEWDIKLEARYGNYYQITKKAIKTVMAMYKAQEGPVVGKHSSIPAIEVPYQVVEDKMAPMSAAIGHKTMQPQ